MITAIPYALTRPLNGTQLLLAALALIGLTTIYCLAYTALAGRAESPLEGVVWALLNIVPWLACFEWAKRIPGWAGRIALVIGFLLVFSGLNSMLRESEQPLAALWIFDIIRRLPAALLILAMLALGAVFRRYAELPKAQLASASVNLPLLAHQIDWVKAAGNYVELHIGDRTVLHRAALSSVAAELAPHGFVRIHRSLLVPRQRIASISGEHLTLDCGQCLRIGNRYRAALY